MQTNLRYLICLLWSVSSSILAMPLLPKIAAVPGGVVILQLDVASTEPPLVYYQESRTLVVPNPKQANHWLTVVGIPLEAKPGKHNIQIHKDQERVTQQFVITPKAYRQEHLRIANPRKVQPLASDFPLIEAQYIETINNYAHWQYQPLSAVTLKLPVQGRKSSPFGLKRIMNNIPQNPHSGLDIAAPKGTPVHAAKAGNIINIGDYFYSGKIVFIDHGQGLITSYAHLDEVKVQRGQPVKQGDVIGTVGNTGRATGPHLHWSVSLNGVRVDPQWFIFE